MAVLCSCRAADRPRQVELILASDAMAPFPAPPLPDAAQQRTLRDAVVHCDRALELAAAAAAAAAAPSLPDPLTLNERGASVLRAAARARRRRQEDDARAIVHFPPFLDLGGVTWTREMRER